MSAVTQPQNESELYRRLRESGKTIEAAAEEVNRAYGRTAGELKATLVRAEERYQHALEAAAEIAEPEPEPEPDRLDVLRQEIEARRDALQGERQRLALDALDDVGARKRLAQVEKQLAECSDELERIDLAVTERERRVVEAIATEEASRRAGALARAREVQPDREQLAGHVDAAALAFARVLRSWDQITTQQEAALREAGLPEAARVARPRPWMIEAALARALGEAGCPRGMIRMEATTAHLTVRQIRPLAETDPRPVEATDPNHVTPEGNIA